jgi:membrane peptidoglycan carboxypeptidase
MGGEDPHGPYGIVAAVMQTSLNRRQRHRRNGAARRGRGGGAGRRIALAIPLLLFSSFLVLGAVGFVGAVSAYAYYSRDLPDPKELFDALAFDEPSVILDRTGEVELAKFGERQRALVTFEQIPPEMIDATTAVEDKDFWKNPGFDLGGFIAASIDTLTGHPRGGSTITQQLVRARLLPESAFKGTVYDRKIREIIQSIRLTQAFPGEDGKKKIIEAYLNQNFYGNQSYGVKAASLGYFGVDMADLSLAQMALLAAIPQSPTQYDLVRNAVKECTIELTAEQTCPSKNVKLVVPDTSEVVQRRNFILQLMETRSTLSGTAHTQAEYEAAMQEEVVLTPQGAPPWKAPHFVWQVRQQLGAILCGTESKDACEKVDTGGYHVTTTLNWDMQQTVEKWLYVAARTTHLKDPKPTWTRLGIPKAEWTWLTQLKRRSIYNAASGVLDYRTGQMLALAGSAGYYLDGNKKFQPQFDVFSDGYRQPGSAIKPINYITGIDDHTLTAATMFMHVVTDFGTKSKPFLPQEADDLERGPVRLRSALQFSLNIASIKAGLIDGLAHTFARFQKFGLSFLPGTVPVVSQSIGTLETHPAELLSAYGAIADGGQLLPRTYILQVTDATGKVVYPTIDDTTTPIQVATPQAAYIVTDILNGNTIKSVNPYWGKWQILEKGKTRRPAAYKTGTTDDNKDVAAYGFLAPPVDPTAPALVVGVWMGNSDSTPNNGSLSLDSSAPTWSRILTEISQGMPIATFKRPKDIVEVKVDAFSGLLPGPYTAATVNEVFIKGTEPTRKDDLHVLLDIDSATNLLWQDGCTGPMVQKPFLDFSVVEPRFPEWQPYTQGWAQRAAKGPGTRGGPKNNLTSYFDDFFFNPFGKTWGGAFAPTEVCQAVVPPTCGPGGGQPVETGPTPEPCPTPAPTPTKGGKPTPSPLPSLGLPIGTFAAPAPT